MYPPPFPPPSSSSWVFSFDFVIFSLFLTKFYFCYFVVCVKKVASTMKRFFLLPRPTPVSYPFFAIFLFSKRIILSHTHTRPVNDYRK